jgi:two-component system NtrC family sensor kinase
MIDEKSRELLTFFEAMVDGAYVIGSDFNVEYMNQAMVGKFGQGIGQKCYRLIHDFDDICPWCRAQEVFSGESVRRQQEIPKIESTYDLVEFPLKNSDGTVSKVGVFQDITEKKKTEERMKASEEDYRRLFENVRSGLYVSSKEGRFLNANQALLDMLDYETKEEFLKINIAGDLYQRSEDRRKFQEMIERDGYVIDYEADLKRRDGSTIPVLLTSHVRYDQAGNVLGYEGIIVDQSPRKQMAEDYRRLFEHVACGVYISTKEGKFLNANQALLDMLGYENKEEFLNIDIARDLYVRPEDRRTFQEMIERNGRVIDHEVHFRRKNGSTVSVLHTAHARYDQQGDVIGYEGINADLSQRKEMEQELREAHDFLTQIIKSSPNAIIATDMKGNIFLWNKAAEENLGYRTDEVIGKMNIKTIYPEGVARKVMKMLRSTEYGGVGKLRSYPMTYVRWDGETVEGDLSSAIIYDDEGKEVASVGIFVDLKERIDMESRLRDTQEQLLQSEKLAAMGRLTSHIAHELNNPLYGIMNTLELLKTEVSPQSKRRKILEMALSETVRLTDLLRKMLSFSKPDEEERQPVDINTILDEILLLVRKQLQEHSIRIALSLAEDVERVYASKNQLRQVFLNMISNARDAMPDGGTLAIKTLARRDTVNIEISDTGVGIRARNLDKIFEAFFTTKESVKGVGLGLSVCYGFIQDHGGDIRVASKTGEGTTFTIVLPVVKQN